MSQNGFTANSRAFVRTLTVPGTSVRLPVRRGPAGDLLVWAAARWHREVEPLIVPGCWGYAERLIRGSSTTLSNHASGTAIDLNAPAHPLGVPATRNLNPGQIATIRRIIADTRGALRWGGDYSGRVDPMHVEINAPESVCATALARLAASGGVATSPPPASSGVRPTIRRGATGPDVELIQRWLDVAAPGNPGYGTFGPATESAVIRYQRMRGLAADGVVGPLTWRATGL